MLARVCALILALGLAAFPATAAAEDAPMDPALAAYVASHFEAVYRMQQTSSVSRQERRRPHLIVVEASLAPVAPRAPLRSAALDDSTQRADAWVLRQIAAKAWSDYTIPGYARPER